MTLPDCGILPKLHIAVVASRERRGFDILAVSLQGYIVTAIMFFFSCQDRKFTRV